MKVKKKEVISFAKRHWSGILSLLMIVTGGIVYTAVAVKPAEVVSRQYIGKKEYTEFTPKDNAYDINNALPAPDGTRTGNDNTETVGSDTAVKTDSKKTDDLKAESQTNLAININSASMEELCRLKGIGESKASAIIAYRQEYGHFSIIEDIMLVPGIKQGTFEKIKDNITVEGGDASDKQ